jgi:hypothetical protein
MDEIIEYNGVFINVTTGEIIDDPFADNVAPPLVKKPERTICGLPTILETEEHLEKYGSLLNNARLQVKMEQEKLDAIIARQKRIIARKTAWVTFLETFYQGQLVELVKQLLPRKPDGSFKRKSLLSSFAEFKLTTSSTRLEVIDTELAVKALRTISPDAIKTTESVLVSKISDDVRAELLDNADLAKTVGFGIIEGSEKINIS